ncbi:hypothetical protein J4Q44_G00174510 [Coregonus suidteri]|uniref:Uncharacterized protein n=1 Tax=Coregonus suidteri TaxID=861788 RepID=A0AAN8LNK7_9TELE
MWRMSNLSSIMTTPTPLRTTSTVSAVRPVAPTRVRPTRFFTPGNLRQARELIRVLEEARQAINPKLLQLVNTGRGGGGRSRYSGNSSNANNPNLMYQDECNRRMRTVSGGSKDSRGSSGGTGNSSSSFSRDIRGGGSSRAGDRSSSSSSSYRDRGSRDSRSYGSNSSSSYDQYQSGSSQYKSGSSEWGAGSVSGAVWFSQQVQSAPSNPHQGHSPSWPRRFTPAQPMMGLMGHSPFQFAPPPPPTSQRK